MFFCAYTFYIVCAIILVLKIIEVQFYSELKEFKNIRTFYRVTKEVKTHYGVQITLRI